MTLPLRGRALFLTRHFGRPTAIEHVRQELLFDSCSIVPYPHEVVGSITRELDFDLFLGESHGVIHQVRHDVVYGAACRVLYPKLLRLRPPGNFDALIACYGAVAVGDVAHDVRGCDRICLRAGRSVFQFHEYLDVGHHQSEVGRLLLNLVE